MELKPASTNVRETQLPAPRTRKRQWTSQEELDDNPAQFRRVRLKYCEIWVSGHGLTSIVCRPAAA